MKRHHMSLALCALVAAFSLAPTCQKPVSRQTRLGLAGIVPPGATVVDGKIVTTPEAWAAFWSFAKAHGDHIAVHSPWRTALPVIEQAKAYGLSTTVVTSITDVTDADVPSYINMVKQAAVYDIRWWCVGNEVDGDPDLAGEASRAGAIMKAIKAAKPSIHTCVVFQYEHSLARTDTASQVALFTEAEGIFFTTYPGLAGTAPYKTAAAIPADYYAKASSWTSKPIGFTEVGWSIEVGGENEQRAFLDRFLQSLAPRSSAIVNWFSPFDIAGYKPFEHVGFCSTATACRPALTTWDTARAIPAS